ncbi:hypothetical protein RUM43_005545 [Polyplax serrata]|uniref:Uncharacterized protein n=1 Tax=Polyplax serrata TaxID=468196 RepID=A0AAN8PWY6_POLSC
MVIERFRLFLLILLSEPCRCNYLASKEWLVDIGKNITLPCLEDVTEKGITNVEPVMWIKSGREEEQINRLKILSDGSLSLEKVIKSDTGEYMCKLEKDRSVKDQINGNELIENNDEIRSRYKLIVRTPPPLLVNVSIHPSTVLALLLWDVYDTGGYDISYFSAQYRLKYDSKDVWHSVLPLQISPHARQIDVYRLIPNSTYTFQIWAVNALGDGEVTEIDGTTNHIAEEIELARHLLDGAENFDTRIWVVAVAVVMGTLIMLSAGTCYILCRECNFSQCDDEEVIELMPNIILNPVFYDGEFQSERFYQLNENFTDKKTIRIIKKSIIKPVRL